MANILGKHFRIMTFGESHGKAIGAVIDGVMPGLKITKEDIQKELDKRKPGQSKVTTQRKEADEVEVLSGIFNGKTTGSPIAMLIWNRDADPKAYERLKDVFRPGHAGYTYMAKYGTYDYRGGGRSSARETANWVMAGAIAKKLLEKEGINVTAYIKAIGNIEAKKFDMKEINRNIAKCPDKNAAERMIALIEKVRNEGDSVGGIIEIMAENVPAGLGDPVFDKLSANIAKAMMTINAVKGVEIGDGFKAARMKGSQHNDLFIKKGSRILTKTNHAGGILGGISNGMPIVVRIAIKPASSIAKEQETLTTSGKKTKIKVEGRHDPCVAIRGVPVAEAMMNIVLADALLSQKNLNKKISAK